MVQIDHEPPFSISTGDRAYKQWFTTPTLPDNRHTLTINYSFGRTIDYAVVQVGKTTSLTGQTVIVDDDSPLIQYSGGWSRNTIAAPNIPSIFPYGNGTHRSSNPGDSFTFRFSGKQPFPQQIQWFQLRLLVSGTSIEVYGTFPSDNVASPNATYSIDGIPHSSSVTILANASSPNYLYFGLHSMPPGTHTLLVSITEANKQPFILDYITYTPAFDTLSSMPSLSAGISGTTARPTANGSHHSGAIIAGGVLGMVAVVVVAILVILFILRRRKAPERNSAYHDAALGSRGGINDANILSA